MMRDRSRVIVAGLVALGLLFFMAGAILVHVSNMSNSTNADLRNVWGPSLTDVGMFLFIAGLLLAALMIEDLDPLVRLVLLLLAFVALLMVLASPALLFA